MNGFNYKNIVVKEKKKKIWKSNKKVAVLNTGDFMKKAPADTCALRDR